MAGDIDFYFDFGSPYAYLAAMRIEGMVPGAVWKPIAFPIMLHELGRLEKTMQRDFAAAAAEVSSRAEARGMPAFSPPPGWPLETWSLVPLRAALVAAEHGVARQFSRAAFSKAYAEGRSLTEAETVHEAAADVGLDRNALDEGIERPEIKQRLKDQTDEALARGVTGIPTVVIGDEFFWGDDRLEEAAAALQQAR